MSGGHKTGCLFIQARTRIREHQEMFKGHSQTPSLTDFVTCACRLPGEESWTRAMSGKCTIMQQSCPERFDGPPLFWMKRSCSEIHVCLQVEHDLLQPRAVASYPAASGCRTYNQLLTLPRGSGIDGCVSSCLHSPSTMNLYWWYLQLSIDLQLPRACCSATHGAKHIADHCRSSKSGAASRSRGDSIPRR